MNTRTGVILAAGKGERLDIQDSAKPLVHVGGKPLIIWNIERMHEYGLEKIYIVLGHKGELVKKELFANPLISSEIVFIESSNWQEGMLNSILGLYDKIDVPFFLCPCDLFFENNPFDYFSSDDMKYEGITSLAYSTGEQEDVTGASSRIKVSKDGSVSYSEQQDKCNGIETGIYHFGRDSLQGINEMIRHHSDIRTFTRLLDYSSTKGLLKIRLSKCSEWFDVNTPSIRIRAEMFLRKHPAKTIIKKHLPKIDYLTTFVTKKEVETKVYVKQNSVKEIGAFELIPEGHADSPHFLITDENVDKLYGEEVYRKLKSSGYNIRKIVLPCGETTKTLQNFINLSEEILTDGIDEKSILISLGGCTINNITGFLASTLYRGIYLIHIPTTLMAQCDAAIGTKQAVNGDRGKNLIGSYYEPLKIIVDPTVILSSGERSIKDGLSECVKHAIAQDCDYYDYLINYSGKVKDVDFIDYVVKRNIELKVHLMKEDPKETAEALVLQYGHTVGHAIEYLSGYKLGHGEAVSIGMVVAARISNKLGIVNYGLVKAHYDILKRYELPVTVDQQIKADDIISALRYNKRYLWGDIQFVLLDKIGSIWDYEGDYSVPCDNNIIKESILDCY